MTQVKVPEVSTETAASIAKRVVPGAPPPVEKATKKKRKANRAEEDGKENSAKHSAVESQSVAQPVPGSAELVSSLDERKSPVIELINKRIRNFTKKIQRVKEYQSKPDSMLNEDQKRALASLASLEGILHELDDTRKAIEPIEAQAIKELTLQRLEAENTENTRIRQAVLNTKADAVSKFSALLHLLACDVTTLALEPPEQSALTNLITHLTSSDSKELVLSNLVNGDGEWEGYSYNRLLELSQRTPEEPTESNVQPEEPVNESAEPADQQFTAQEDATVLAESEVDKPVGGVSAPTASGFHFMLESELEPQPQAVEEGAGDSEPVVNGTVPVQEPQHVERETDDPIPALQAENIDWAADDATDLPPINSLEAKFGTSGEVTPEAQAEPVREPVEKAATQSHKAEADGFISIPSRRGGGDRGFRGGERGGERGGRGRGYRGGRGGSERGRGRGGHRGGERGSRGSFRGGRSAAEPTAA